MSPALSTIYVIIMTSLCLLPDLNLCPCFHSITSLLSGTSFHFILEPSLPNCFLNLTLSITTSLLLILFLSVTVSFVHLAPLAPSNLISNSYLSPFSCLWNFNSIQFQFCFLYKKTEFYWYTCCCSEPGLSGSLVCTY